MAKGQSKTKRQSLTLSIKTLKYLDILATKGTHGDNVPNVAKTLIEQGIRRAIETGYLKLPED